MHPKCKKRQIIFLEKMVAFGPSGPVVLEGNFLDDCNMDFGSRKSKYQIFESCNKVKIILIANTIV